MTRLKLLTRLSLTGGVFFALWWGVYLQEWRIGDDDVQAACASNGISLPLAKPKIVVSYDSKTLSLFEGDILLKRYDIAVGHTHSPGIYRRDAGSTPLGHYKIIAKKTREDVFRRGSRFLLIDYPNFDDIEKCLDAGLINYNTYERCSTLNDMGHPMPQDTKIGGGLGIQGNFFIFMSYNFTDGSIAMRNSDINELFPYVSVGTPVIIER